MHIHGEKIPKVKGWKLIAEDPESFDKDSDVVSYQKTLPGDLKIAVEFALKNPSSAFNHKKHKGNPYQVLKAQGEENFKQVKTGGWMDDSDIKNILEEVESKYTLKENKAMKLFGKIYKEGKLMKESKLPQGDIDAIDHVIGMIEGHKNTEELSEHIGMSILEVADVLKRLKTIELLEESKTVKESSQESAKESHEKALGSIDNLKKKMFSALTNVKDDEYGVSVSFNKVAQEIDKLADDFAPLKESANSNKSDKVSEQSIKFIKTADVKRSVDIDAQASAFAGGGSATYHEVENGDAVLFLGDKLVAYYTKDDTIKESKEESISGKTIEVETQKGVLKGFVDMDMPRGEGSHDITIKLSQDYGDNKSGETIRFWLDDLDGVKILKESKGFADDEEKMADFRKLSKEEFLKSYSYLTDEEYEATAQLFKESKITGNSFYLDLCDDQLDGVDTYSVGYYMNGEGKSAELGCMHLGDATKEANKLAKDLGIEWDGEWNFDGSTYFRNFKAPLKESKMSPEEFDKALAKAEKERDEAKTSIELEWAEMKIAELLGNEESEED